jgi:hypothetical protein
MTWPVTFSSRLDRILEWIASRKSNFPSWFKANDGHMSACFMPIGTTGGSHFRNQRQYGEEGQSIVIGGLENDSKLDDQIATYPFENMLSTTGIAESKNSKQ